MDARTKAAIKRVGCGRDVVMQVASEMFDKHEQAQRLQREVNQLSAWLKFHDQKNLATYQSIMRVYRLEDGETHWVVAASGEQAVDWHIQTTGLDFNEPTEVEYQELPPDIGVPIEDENSVLLVKSCADWAAERVGDEPWLLGSTCY